MLFRSTAQFREMNPTVHSVLENFQNCKTAIFGARRQTRTPAKLFRQRPRHLILINYSLMTAQINPDFPDPYKTRGKNVRLIWRLIPLAILWSVWTIRNESKFDGKKMNREESADIVKIRVAFWAKLKSRFNLFSVNDVVYNLGKVVQGM